MVRFFASFVLVCFTLLPASANEKLIVPLNDTVSLSDGQWEFYWQQHLSPAQFRTSKAPTPDILLDGARTWHNLELAGKELPSFGYATYRRRVKIDGPPKLGLYAPWSFTSYRLYINGRLAHESGVAGKTAASTVPGREVTRSYFENKTGTLELVVHVSNFIHHKAGIRGPIRIGDAALVKLQQDRNSGLDLFAIGIIFTIMLYHLALAILRRGQGSYLIFAGLAFVYFLLAFIYGQHSVSLLFPSLPMNAHLHLGSLFIYLFPPFLIAFVDSLFPGFVHRHVHTYFRGLALLFILLLLAPAHIFTQIRAYYYVPGALFAVILALFITIQAFRFKKPGSLLLLFGVGFFTVLTFYAIYLAQTDRIAGSIVTAGFASFAVFQAMALAREHALLDRQNELMHKRVLEGREAIAAQRRELEANLHDSLGGGLTDLKLSAENLSQDKLPVAAGKKLKAMLKRIDATIGSFRTQLLFLDDIEMVMSDFFSGIQLILLRRYTSVGRELDFTVSDAARNWIESSSDFSDANKLNLTLVLQEVCTNSLKYGSKETSWSFDVKGDSLYIEATNRAGKKKPAQSKSGKGRRTMELRLKSLNGILNETATKEAHTVQLKIPVDL